MTFQRWTVTVFLGSLFVSELPAQAGKTILIGGEVVDYGLASLQLENIKVSSTEVVCNFFFRNNNSQPNYRGADEVFGLSGAYLDNYKNATTRGIDFGRTYLLRSRQEMRFSVKLNRPADALHLSGITLGSGNRNATLKLSDRYRGRVDFDLSGAIGSVPYKKIPDIAKPAESSDTMKPVIRINSPKFTQGILRTDDFSVIISGTVQDNVGIATVSINGKAASLKPDGRFQKRLKLKFGKNPIVISAIDINDNKAISRTTVIREEIIEDDEFSDVDFAPELGKTNRNGVAVVIGIQEYQYAPEVSYALNDADIFREYLIKTFGYKRENIYFRLDDRATKGEFEKIFARNGWLANNITNQSEIIIFYAGHGAPDLEAGLSYLIPFDIDPNYTTTGYALDELYQNLGKLKVNSITVILDACFSGGSRDNQPLLADARPVYISVEGGTVPKNTVVFSAASGREISSAYKQKLHGLFTYFFLKGLNGNADENKDKKITVMEMQGYLEAYVPQQARKMGREQTPTLIGKDGNRILLRY